MSQQIKKKILITGGAGYIGSYVNKLLNSYGYETIVLDNLISGDKRTLTGGTFIEGNFGDEKILNAIFSNHAIYAVFHFAAYIKICESTENPSKYYQNNLINTCILLDHLIKYNIKHFVFSSSAAIFGSPQKEKIDETHEKKPINPYGRSKKMLEDILADYHRAYGLNYCSLRYFNAAGGDPEKKIRFFQKNPYNLIPRAIINLFSDNPEITIFGVDYPTKDGSCIRDYVHIHDIAKAHILALEELFRDGGANAYNLGNETGFSVKEIIRTIENLTCRKFKIKEGKRREGDPAILIADAAKAKSMLNWTPLYTNLEEIIKHSIQCIT